MSMASRHRRRLARPSIEPLEGKQLLSVGGGFAGAGLEGDYFANTTLSGAPAFSRRDARVDFDWGTNVPVGGSNSPGFAAVKTDAFSVRWTGDVVANFSETYKFIATTDDGVRLMIRPSGTSSWTTLISDWTPHAARDDSGSYAMTAGRTYDIEMDYNQLYVDAVAHLAWSGPSTPREIIDPLATSGINAVTYSDQVFADAMKAGRAEWGDPTDYFNKPKVAADANGWPLADATKVVWEGRDPLSMAGTYLLQFNGEADVTTGFNYGQFSAAGKVYGNKLPSGAGYDPTTNTTTATMQINQASILYLNFENSQRTATSPLHSGVTDVKLMRPSSPGATTYDPVGTIFDQATEAAFANFSTERWLTANFDTTQVNWSDRVLPGYQKANYGDRGEVWEYLVMLANETGKDLYITIPMNASADYVTKLAELIRYGSDGVNPYTTQQPRRAYPGLNPNLKLYVEWSNETWNWSFSQAGAGYTDAQQAVQNKTPEGQIIDFDGAAPNGDFRRWTALKTVEASNAFRSVFGGAAMGSRVRPLLEYQYNDGQGTATTSLRFIDDYFNNADGVQHVATPHPVSYYLWGAGGATYYGAADPNGYQTAVAFGDPGFESIPIAPGTTSTDPTGSPWTFSGDAGVVGDAVRVPDLASESLGTLSSSTSGATYLGYKFTVGPSNIGVYQLGRWAAAGDSQKHTVAIVRASDKAQMASATVATSGASAGGYVYASLSRPVILAANTTYYVLSSEADGKDAFYGADTRLTPADGISVLGAASGGNTPSWAVADGPSGAVGYGPVDFKFSTSPPGNLGFVADAPEGVQAAFLGAGGSISQAVDFPTTGVFSLEVTAATKDGASDPIRVFVDGVEATPNGGDYRPGTSAWTPGQYIFGVDDRNYNVLGTAPFTISSSGNHTITFVGVGKAGQYTFLDNLKITSLDAIFAGGVPSTGQANGQPQVGLANFQSQLNAQADYALSYGLHVVAYEGGWSLGGDAGGTPLQNYAKYVDPRAAAANRAALDAFSRSGGSLDMFGTYAQWPVGDAAHAASYPLLRSVIAADAAAPASVTNGLAVPSNLTVADRTYASWGLYANRLSPSGYMTWNVLVPAAGVYSISMQIGTGGQGSLSVDDTTTLATGTSGLLSGQVRLSAGVHVVRVQAKTGFVYLQGGSIYLA